MSDLPKNFCREINEALSRTFVTELEREDIEQLANVLYKIPKTVEKIAERFLICTGRVQGAEFSRHMEMIESAAETVVAMVKELRKKLHLERMKEMNARLQHIEGEADKLIMELLIILNVTELPLARSPIVFL